MGLEDYKAAVLKYDGRWKTGPGCSQEPAQQALVREALAEWNAAWNRMTPLEQGQAIRWLGERKRAG